MAQHYTRKIIREKFVDMLNMKKLTKITVKDLSKACEINRNTFYYYYADIYEILTEIFELQMQTVIEEYNETLSWEESFLVATRFILENKVAIYHVYDSLQRKQLEDYIYNVSGNIMKKYVENIASETKSSDTDKKLIASFYQCALTEMLMRWIDTGMKDDPNKVIRRIGKLFDGNILLSLKRSENLI